MSRIEEVVKWKTCAMFNVQCLPPKKDVSNVTEYRNDLFLM